MASVIGMLALFPRPGANVNVISYHVLRPRMTLKEVELMLGCKPGDYRLSKSSPAPLPCHVSTTLGVAEMDVIWISDFGRIGVSFDRNGKLNSCTFSSVDAAETLPVFRRLQYDALRDMFEVISLAWDW